MPRWRSLPFLLLALGGGLLLPGCTTTGAPSDSLSIREVKSSPVPGGGYTSYKVRAAYTLASAAKGKVGLGFDGDEPGKYRMVNDVTVERGSGEVELIGDVRHPPRRILSIYINLSPEPHPPRWTPLASDTRRIELMP